MASLSLALAGVCVGALLRPGDTSLGDDDAKTINRWVRRLRDEVGHDVMVTAPIDAGGDCAAILGAFHTGGARFIAKGKWGFDLREAVRSVTKWTTVDRDACDRPTRQVAELDFHRTGWGERGHHFRVFAVRSNERDTVTQLPLWAGHDYTAQVYITNDWQTDADELAWGVQRPRRSRARHRRVQERLGHSSAGRRRT